MEGKDNAETAEDSSKVEKEPIILGIKALRKSYGKINNARNSDRDEDSEADTNVNNEDRIHRKTCDKAHR